MKKINILKTKTAVIILSIFLLLLMIAIFYFFDNVYQKQTETFPQLTIYYKNKEIGKMAVVNSTWTYKGENKTTNLCDEYITDFEFPEENTVLISKNMSDDYVVKSDFRYKNYGCADKLIEVATGATNTGSTGYDCSKLLQKGQFINVYSNVAGEYVYTLKINCMQGSVTYAMKIITFEQAQAETAKNYLNTSIENVEKIEKLVSEIRYGNLLNSVKMDGKNAIIEYKYHIDDDAIRMNNLTLFTCIPELESITYAPSSKKTMYNRIEEEESQLEYGEVEKRVYTREQTDSKNLANLENFKKFMEQI